MHYDRAAARAPGLASSMQADIPQLYFDVDRDKGAVAGGFDVRHFSTMKAFTGSIYVNDFNMFNRIPCVFRPTRPIELYRET